MHYSQGRTPLLTRYVLQSLVGVWVLTFFSDVAYALVNVPFYVRVRHTTLSPLPCIHALSLSPCLTLMAPRTSPHHAPSHAAAGRPAVRHRRRAMRSAPCARRHETIGKLELYRLFLAPLFGNSFFSLIFVGMTLTSMGTRLEFSMGTARLGALMLTISLATNLVFVLMCYLMASFGSYEALFFTCQGFWVILMGLIVVECLSSPEGTRRLLFIPMPIPTKYYPLALYVLFSVFTGPRVDTLISMGIGYLYQHGYLDRAKPSAQRVSDWESGFLANFVSSQNFIVGGSAQGDSAWLPMAAPSDRDPSSQQHAGGGGTSFSNMFQSLRGAGSPAASSDVPTDRSAGAAPAALGRDGGADTFTGTGHALGGGSRHPNPQSARAAMLAAAEARGGS